MIPPVGKGTAHKRPRVLVVDDHRGVLDHAVEMLDHAFEIAGTAMDGRQAIEAARRVDPDAIVLDINMPELDGFQALTELRREGSRAKVVFMSMLDAEDEIAAAYRLGGSGYVIKSRMARDLESALGHVLAGRQFAPSLITLAAQMPNGGHAWQMQESGEGWADEVLALFAHALSRGDATCLIADASIRAKFAAHLGHPRYLAVDTAGAMSRFLRDGMPDTAILEEIIRELDHYRIASAGPDARLLVVGRMAGQLFADGNTAGALAIETAWDRLTKDLPFLTICGYVSESCHHAHPDHWAGICDSHSAVSHASNL